MNGMIPAGWDDLLCEGWIPSESGMTSCRRGMASLYDSLREWDGCLRRMNRMKTLRFWMIPA